MKLLIGALFITVIALSCIAGVVFLVVDRSITTKVSQSGIMVSKESNQPVKVMVNSQPLALNSRLPNEAFKQLKHFEAYSVGGNYVFVVVNGFARICSLNGGADVIKMLTPYVCYAVSLN